MPLDFIAADKQKNIDGKSACFSLSESAHQALLSASSPRNAFPKIQKFADYYADTSILFVEIQPLLLEIGAAARARNILSGEILALITFLGSAYCDGLNIYIFADLKITAARVVRQALSAILVEGGAQWQWHRNGNW